MVAIKYRHGRTFRLYPHDADDWIRTTDLWFQGEATVLPTEPQSLPNLSPNYCSRFGILSLRILSIVWHQEKQSEHGLDLDLSPFSMCVSHLSLFAASEGVRLSRLV